MSTEPDTDTKRQILTNKLQQYKAKGYDHAVTAHIAERLGSTKEAEDQSAISKRMYHAARETQALLDELAEEAEGED